MSTPSTINTSSGTRAGAAPAAVERPRRLRARTLDDKLSLAGAAAGSLALTWLVYGKILPFSGLIGFLLVWYVVFLLMYATVTSLFVPLLSGRPIFLVPEQDQIDELRQLLSDGREFTLVKATPAHLEALRALVRDGGPALRIRTLVVGGEALPAPYGAGGISHERL